MRKRGTPVVRRGWWVDVLREGPEACPSRLDLINCLEKVLQAQGKADILRRDNHVPWPEFGRKTVERGPGPDGFRDRLCEDPFRPDGGERIAPAVEVLVLGRNTRIP
jgi:hypothetical protein